MRLIDTILIKTEPSQIWRLLANPQLHPQWNPHVVLVDAPDRLLRIGDRYKAIHVLGGRERETDVEVIDLCEPSRLTLLYCYTHATRPQTAKVTYELVQQAANTSLRQSVDLGQGVPKLIQPLIWLLHRFGKQTDWAPLERLAHLAEQVTAH